MIRLNLVSVGMVEETGSVILVLRAPEQARLLVMEVGLLEGRAIALEAEGVKAPRPLTHELTLSVMERLGARLHQVEIRDFRDKTFFANLILAGEGGRELAIDARPSDAIALALRAGAPIFATQQVISVAGIEEEAEDLFEDADETDEEDDDDGESILH